MNIVLTQKDADYIAGVIRNQLIDLQEAYDEAMKEGTKRAEFCESLVRQLENISPEDVNEIATAKAELKKVKDDAIKNLTEKYNNKQAEYCKILELVMCGSESLG